MDSPLLILGGVGIDVLVAPDGSEEKRVGGSAWYAALAAGLFHPVSLLSAVGGDFPESALNDLRARGVGLESLLVDANGRSFFWKARYSENADERVTLELEPNVEETFDPVPPAPQPAFVFMANCQPRLQRRLLEGLRPGSFVAMDTIDRWIERARSELLQMLPSVDLFFINAQEATQLSGQLDPVAAGRAILDLGPRFCIVKDGASGSHVFSHGESHFVPVRPVQRLVDATGAGDVFAGALMGLLASQFSSRAPQCAKDLLPAARAGAAVASYKIEGPGAANLLGDSVPILKACGLAP